VKEKGGGSKRTTSPTNKPYASENETGAAATQPSAPHTYLPPELLLLPPPPPPALPPLFFLAGLRIRFGLRAGVGTGRLSGELLLAARLSPDGRRRDMVAVRGVFLVYNKPYCGYSATSTLS
jgi:hypothetical protein